MVARVLTPASKRPRTGVWDRGLSRPKAEAKRRVFAIILLCHWGSSLAAPDHGAPSPRHLAVHIRRPIQGLHAQHGNTVMGTCTHTGC